MHVDHNWKSIGSVILATSGPRVKRKKVLVNKGALKTCTDYFRKWMDTGSCDLESLLVAQRNAERRKKAATDSASSSREKYVSKVQALLPDLTDVECDCIRQSSISHVTRKQIMQTAMIRNADWKPHIEVLGNTQRDIVEAGSRPVIYWIDNTIHAELQARIAIFQRNIKAMHYSDHVHEKGGIWLARKLVQRPIFKLEQRFMSERILSRPHTHFNSMRRFAQAMRGNKAVFSMNNAFLGRRHTCTPISDELCFIQATAPLNMARKYNALIVPVTALEAKPFEHYTVQFHEPLEADMSLSRDDDFRRMAYLSTARQLKLIKNHPDQYLCFVGDQLDMPENGRIKRYGM